MIDESVPEEIDSASLASKGSKAVRPQSAADPFGNAVDPLTGLPMPPVESDSEEDLAAILEAERKEFDRQLRNQYMQLQTQLQQLGEVNDREEKRVKQNEVVILRLFKRSQQAKYLKG